jgi:NAD(P)-dependent dehydrogenase (short-subunit alcohol dehydrogenase family)
MPVSSQRLAGKTAVITGTASGQGRAAALAFAAAGAFVVGCDMDDDGAAATVAAVTRFAPVEDLTFADWKWNVEHEMDVVFLPVKYFWLQLVKAGNAAVVLVGSTAGVTGSMTNGRLAHTATKGAVVAMTKQLAAEGAPHGVRVNAVSPGMIRTAATEGNLLAPDHPMRTIAGSIPLGRI